MNSQRTKTTELLNIFLAGFPNPPHQVLDSSMERVHDRLKKGETQSIFEPDDIRIPAPRRWKRMVVAATVMSIMAVLSFALMRERRITRAGAVPAPITPRGIQTPQEESRSAPRRDSVSGQQLPAKPAPAIAFEVAAIKPTLPENTTNGSMTLFPPGRFRQTNATLRDLVRLAYNVQEFQISGGTAWTRTDRFDVEAKAESPVDRDQILLMIQAMLADQFKLKIKQTTEEASVYNLVRAKSGVKMKLAPGSESPNARFNGFEGPRTMERFASYLSGVIGQPVVDRTELEGPYDIKLQFTPEWVRESAAGKGTVNFNGQTLDASGPSIFSALESQLGLKLEPGKAPVRFLVIEGAEKPSL